MFFFLDINGVLNQRQEEFTIDEDCVQQLCRIAVMLDAKIILTSVLRTGYMKEYERCSPEIRLLRDALKRYGVDIFGRTVSGDSRFREIVTYLQNTKYEGFMIFDDDSSLFPAFENNHIYIVDPGTGFTEEDAKRVRHLQMLLTSEDKVMDEHWFQ